MITAERELTLRGIALGVAITLLFTAANVYLGLKVGLTFASSIPAAVISMAVLSFFSGSNIRENNIVQTTASAAGALAAIIFVLPGLVIIGWWTAIPVLGIFSRLCGRRNAGRAVHHSVAAGSGDHFRSSVPGRSCGGRSAEGRLRLARRQIPRQAATAREGLVAIVIGSLASAGLALLVATRVAASDLQSYFRIGPQSASGYDLAFSLALIGAGHLVGLQVGIAMLTGLLIAWGARLADPDCADFPSRRDSGSPCDEPVDGPGALHRRRRHGASRRSGHLLRLAGPLISGFVAHGGRGAQSRPHRDRIRATATFSGRQSSPLPCLPCRSSRRWSGILRKRACNPDAVAV